LELLHGPGALAEHRRDLVDGEIADDPKQQDLALVRGERRQQPGDALEPESRSRRVFDVIAGRLLGELELLGHRLARAPRNAAALIEQAVMGDRECPRPEATLVPFEPLEVADDLQEHLAEQVVGIRRAARPHVAEQRWRELRVELAPRRLDAAAGVG
jgi:hypothetical protein